MSNNSLAELSALPPAPIRFEGFDTFEHQIHFIDKYDDVWGLDTLGVKLAGRDSDIACTVLSVTPESLATKWGMKKGDVIEGPDCRQLTIHDLEKMLVLAQRPLKVILVMNRW